MSWNRRIARIVHGFTLIEVTIAFLIIGLLFSGGLFVAGNVFRTDQTRTAQVNMDKIERALVEFATVQRRLPCPTRLGLAPEGREHRNADGSCLSDQANGVVPWRSIGLSRDEVLDPWNRYVTYRVDDTPGVGGGVTRDNGIDMSECDPAQTNDSPGDCSGFDRSPRGFLQDKGVRVTDDGVNLLADPMAGSGAAFVLISHGANGYYGIENPDILIPPGPDAHALEANNAVNQPFDPEVDTLAQAAPGAFDDIVRWRTILWVAQAAGSGPGAPPPDDTSNDAEYFGTFVELGLEQDPLARRGLNPSRVRPYELVIDGKRHIFFGEETEEGGSLEEVGRNRRGCMWEKVTRTVTSQQLRVYFTFQFFPGEQNHKQNRGTGHGFTFAMLPGSVNVDIEPVPCDTESHSGNLAFGGPGLPIPKMAVEFDIRRDIGDPIDDPLRNHVAVFLVHNDDNAEDGTQVSHSDDPEHNPNDNPTCRPPAILGNPGGCTMGADGLRAWLEERVDPEDGGQDIPLVHPSVWGKWDTRTRPYGVRMEIDRLCDSTCSVCRTPGVDQTYIRYKIWVDCDTEDCKDLSTPKSSNIYSMINYCAPEPTTETDLMFDQLRTGFTYSTGRNKIANSGVHITDVTIETH